MTKAAGDGFRTQSNVYKDKSKPQDIRSSNMTAAKGLADAVRTSLGPKGMDKMIQKGNSDVTITNDGATILQLMNVVHPAAKLLVELSQAQDVEAGDGTTTVVIIAGALLEAAEKLIKLGIHPTTISDSYSLAVEKAVSVLKDMSIPLQESDNESLVRSASTSLNSKVVSQYSSLLAPLAVNAVLKIADPKTEKNVDLKDIKVIKKLGGTVEDTELIDGLVFASRLANTTGPKRLEKVKIGFIQFCISPPKTDMDHNIVVSNYNAMDRIFKEERAYIINIVKQIKKAGCTMLLVQKSILRDALSDLAVHLLEKLKIMVVKDVEREDVDFICKTLGCRPIASLDHFTSDALVGADLAEEISVGSSRIVKITGIHAPAKTVTILVRGSNNLVLEEADRSIHDALCVIRSLIRERALLPGGGAPEIEMSLKLGQYAQTLSSVDAFCIREYARALEIIPYTLSENAGLNPVATVTELRQKHSEGQTSAGINVRKGQVTDILEENVLQPMLVSKSAITLATETVRSILKIDDILNVAH